MLVPVRPGRAPAKGVKVGCRRAGSAAGEQRCVISPRSKIVKSAVGKFVGAALASSVFVVGLQGAAMAKAANRIDDKAAKATAVSDEGIYQLYKNRSWRWGNHGAAYF